MIKEFDIDLHKNIIYVSLNGYEPHLTIKFKKGGEINAVINELKSQRGLNPNIKPLGMSKREWNEYENMWKRD